VTNNRSGAATSATALCPSAAVLLPPFRQTGTISCIGGQGTVGRGNMRQGSPRAEDDWLRTEENSPRGSAHPNARLDPRFGSRPIEPSGRMKRQASERPSIGRRMFRSITRFTVAALIGVGATLGWQSYGDVAGEMLAERAPALAWLMSMTTTKSPIAAKTATSQTQQIEPLASNLEAVRLSVDQLSAKQDQMAQRIAVLQAVEEDIRQKMSLMPPFSASASQAAPIPQQKPAPPKTTAPAAPLSSAPRPPPAGPSVLPR
jgi:hypothetical protein